MIESDLAEVKKLLDSGRKVAGLLAPVIGEVEEILRKAGFAYTAAIKDEAQKMAGLERRAWTEREKDRDLFLTSSCPVIADMIRSRYPAIAPCLSATPSPMALAAEKIRKRDPESVLVFIGPCHEKKWEKRPGSIETAVDYALQPETLAVLLKDRGICMEPEELCRDQHEEDELGGKGGIVAVMRSVIPEGDSGAPRYASYAGLEECRRFLEEVMGGKHRGEYVELSACAGGCYGRLRNH